MTTTAGEAPEMPETDTLLTAAEVADRFKVKRKTVWGWGRSGRLTRVLTPGGHCRFRESEIRILILGGTR